MSNAGSAGVALRGPGRPQRVAAPVVATLVPWLGVAGLAACAVFAIWIAAAAADGRYLLELPGGANPAWIDGPLRGLSTAIGPLGPRSFSAAVLGLAAAYLLALACAGSVSLRVAMIAIVVSNVAFTLGPTLVSTDVFGYIAYARLELLHGLNPYINAPSAAPHDAILPLVYWKHATSPYGPLFTLASAPLALLPPASALWIYKAIAGIASIALAALVARIAATRGSNPARAAIFVGLNPVLLVYAVSGAHNDLLGTLLVLGAIALAMRGRARAAAGTAVAAAAIKVTLGLALPFVLIGSGHRRRAITGAAVAIALGGLATLALFGTHVFEQLHRIMTDPRFDILGSGPDRLATALGTHIGPGVRAVSVASAAMAAALALMAAWRGRDWITAAGWATLALLVSLASLAPWYLVWLLPLAALGRSRALRVAALLATGYLLALHVPALGGHPWLSAPG